MASPAADVAVRLCPISDASQGKILHRLKSRSDMPGGTRGVPSGQVNRPDHIETQILTKDDTNDILAGTEHGATLPAGSQVKDVLAQADRDLLVPRQACHRRPPGA